MPSSSAARRFVTTDALEQRYRRALADTHDQLPRPVSSLELPLKADKLMTPQLMASLRPAAVLVPLVRRAEGLQLLLTRRADHLRSHSGQVSFPGGRCEDTDAALAATALREAEEEVGIAPDRVEVIGYLDDYPTMTRFRVTPVVGVLDAPGAYRPDPGEVAEVFEVPADLFLKPASFERKVFSKEGINLPFFEINYSAQRIWGATAGMLWNLHSKLMAADGGDD